MTNVSGLIGVAVLLPSWLPNCTVWRLPATRGLGWVMRQLAVVQRVPEHVPALLLAEAGPW